MSNNESKSDIPGCLVLIIAAILLIGGGLLSHMASDDNDEMEDTRGYRATGHN